MSSAMDAATRRQLEAARANREPQKLLDYLPYITYLGLKARITEAERLELTMPFSTHLIGNPVLPALHGGTIGALMDATALLDLLWAAPERGVAKTVNISISYLASGKPKDTHARAQVLKLGRRVAVIDAFAWQDDPETPIASLHGHFLVGSVAPE